MSATTLAADQHACKMRTRRSLIGSGVLHAAVLLWLALQTAVRAEEEVLTEVTWLEPLPAEATPPVATSPVVADPEPAPAVAKPEPDPAPERFERLLPVAGVVPVPQVSGRTTDALESRLASLRDERKLSKPGLAAAMTDPAVSRPALASPSAADVPRAGRVALTREDTARPAPVAMTRGSRPGTSRHLPMSTIATPSAERAPAMSGPVDSTMVKELAGARLLGPVANRALVSHRVPEYPEWAKHEGVEGTVSIRFLVQPDGKVRENVLVERTSGFEDFDGNATDALLTWRFEPLSGSAIGDQWGVITFNYRLGAR